MTWVNLNSKPLVGNDTLALASWEGSEPQEEEREMKTITSYGTTWTKTDQDSVMLA